MLDDTAQQAAADTRQPSAPRKRSDHKAEDALILDPLPDDDLIALIVRVGCHYHFTGSEFRSAFFAAARSPEPARIAYTDIASRIHHAKGGKP